MNEGLKYRDILQAGQERTGDRYGLVSEGDILQAKQDRIGETRREDEEHENRCIEGIPDLRAGCPECLHERDIDNVSYNHPIYLHTIYKDLIAILHFVMLHYTAPCITSTQAYSILLCSLLY